MTHKKHTGSVKDLNQKLKELMLQMSSQSTDLGFYNLLHTHDKQLSTTTFLSK